MYKIDLSGNWTFYDEAGTAYAGNVPGCVHTDLFTPEELYFDKNSLNSRFIEEKDWKYVKRFEVKELLEAPVLVFEGLDTYCDIYLNHKKVGSADNMFIPHRFPVEGILQEGENLLEVCFFSAVKAVEGKEKLQGAFTTERLHSRRMQCTYGWDWVDRFVTCGIYRPVYVAFEDGMELEHVYVFTTGVDRYSAQIKVTETFRGYAGGGLVRTEIISPQGECIHCAEQYCQEEQSVLYIDIEEPRLWYPIHYGQQPLYTLKITVGNNVFCQKFGIRTVKILQLKDKEESVIAKCKALQQTDSGKEYDQNEEYSGFILLINGTRIYCTGANWVPCEPFPSAEAEEKITTILETAAAAGINMIRVWGGGLFEKQHFYDECDRLGILVTQDFLMACGKYPEEEAWFREQLRKEAEFAALYLRNHPSLVWWSGDNENAVRGSDVSEQYMGRISARKVIAPVLERLDHNRTFLFSSPYGGVKYASKTVGTTHNTQFLNHIFQYMEREDLSDYREYWKDYVARFIAEEPCMGAVCQQSLDEFISREQQDSREMWLHHTKGNPALEREVLDIYSDCAEKLFGAFEDWEDRYFKLRYLQYEWIRFTLGNIRSNLWFNSGIIYWMLNDCWPAAMGWALIDYYNRPKGGYFAMKSHGQPVTGYISKEAEGYALHVSEIREQDTECRISISVINIRTGGVKELQKETLWISSGCEYRLLAIRLEEDEVLIADLWTKDGCQRSWYKEGPPKLKKCSGLHYKNTGNGVEVWADCYVHAVEIEGAEEVSDNYFSLLPGERRMVSCCTVSSNSVSSGLTGGSTEADACQVKVRGYTFG